MFGIIAFSFLIGACFADGRINNLVKIDGHHGCTGENIALPTSKTECALRCSRKKMIAVYEDEKKKCFCAKETKCLHQDKMSITENHDSTLAIIPRQKCK